MARGKGKPGGCLLTIIIFACLVVFYIAVTLIGNGVKNIKEEKAAKEALAIAQAYDESMQPLQDDDYVCPETADKAVAYEIKDDVEAFVDEYIPEELKAQSYEDVRYLVTVTYIDSDCTTYKGNEKVEANCVVEVTDLLTGNLLAKRSSTKRTNDDGELKVVDGFFYVSYTEGNGIFLFEWLPAAIEEGRREMEIQMFHETMAAVLESGNHIATGTKAIALVYGEEEHVKPVYQMRYIPESLRTTDPAEVRYVVHCKQESVSVGFYTFGGGAFQRNLVLEVVDLTTGEIVLETTLEGGDPPQTTTNSESQYGDLPTDAEVESWLDENLSVWINDADYHETMAAVIGSGNPPLAGNKAVALVFTGYSDFEGTYKTDYLPADRVTDDPALVRYVVECKSDEKGVCRYADFSTGYQRLLTVKIIDLTTGKTVQTKIFEGSQPPSTKSGFGNAYGDYPSPGAVIAWLEEVFASLA